MVRIDMDEDIVTRKFLNNFVNEINANYSIWQILNDVIFFLFLRYMAESVGSAAMPEAEAAAETTSPSSEDQAEDEDKPPHDNYVNFDVAKTVLEANARKEAQVTERGEYGQNETSSVSP